ncbi:hypothetical protein HYH03_011314 [Edaphochlamys debaryana]|uniref:S1 motif domain-containing protein n=1 Tax=Edaphochlamys debaryana TaxID=47281 RepID=A0A835XU64_9CHLO|nr:hypothetical protein HYH03_011314 [Edaphochlamys debaryana]|eukprot:KAG2490186.1 hypothetical protein HYH03_011314 [Edaphochlamys debaryana]
MLRNLQLVYDKAEEMAAKWLKKQRRRERVYLRNKAFIDCGRAEAGTLVEGTVLATTPAGIIVSLGAGAAAGLITNKHISAHQVESAVGLLTPGTQVRAIVLPRTKGNDCSIFLSTKALEPSPGDMLREPQLVYDMAEEMAAVYRALRNEEMEKRRLNHTFIRKSGVQGRKLHKGVVVEVKPHVVMVELAESGATALLRKEMISAECVEAAGDVLKVGDKVRACLMYIYGRRIFITTRPLETMPGDMLRDPGRVYEQAGAVFEAWLENAGTRAPAWGM